MKVAIIITTLSQEKLLKRNIMSIEAMSKNKNYKIYLVDDSGDGKIGKRIKKDFPKVRVVINKGNLGFSMSNNIGIRLATKEYNPDYFLILNDDCEIIQKGWLDKFVKASSSFRAGGIFGCKIIYPDGSLQWGTSRGQNYFFKSVGTISNDDKFSKTQETTEIIGACMLIKKEVMAKTKGFDEGFSPFYGEESDLCFRAKKKGYKIIYIGGLSLIHHRNKSISQLTKEDVWFIKKRNSVRLEWRHYSLVKKIYYTLVHLGSVFKNDGIPLVKKLRLLLDAYIYNWKNFKEIRKF